MSRIISSKFEFTIFKERARSWAKTLIFSPSFLSQQIIAFRVIRTKLIRVADSSIVYNRRKFDDVTNSKFEFTSVQARVCISARTFFLARHFQSKSPKKYNFAASELNSSSCRFLMFKSENIFCSIESMRNPQIGHCVICNPLETYR